MLCRVSVMITGLRGSNVLSTHRSLDIGKSSRTHYIVVLDLHRLQ